MPHRRYIRTRYGGFCVSAVTGSRYITFFALFTLFPLVALASGQAGCPCLTSHGTALDLYKNSDDKIVYDGFVYPDDYGLLCKQQDIDPVPLQPYCGDSNGNLKSDAPEWCDKSFCYVDSNNCNKMMFLSGYFPNSGLYYSFQTCGSTGTFNEWYSESSTRILNELASVVEGYVASIRSNLESEYVSLGSSPTSCDTTSCDCTTCETASWGTTKVDYDSTMFLPNSITPASTRSQCLANKAHVDFSRIAAREYQDTDHMGTLYGGFQADGSFIQWPAFQWCPATYDPRFRPWYAAASTGPKMMILVMDCSGSMSVNNRIQLSRDSAKAVLDTLTWRDQVGFVLFNDNIKNIRLPVFMTDNEKETTKIWIDSNVVAGGYTTFSSPLLKALEMIENEETSCTNIVLFLTDGQPITPFTREDYENIHCKAKASDTIIFTYAVGDGADSDITNSLACENDGIGYVLSDSDDLGNVMSSYYTYFATALSFYGYRWVLYNDKATETETAPGVELLSACTPLYDQSSTNELPIIVGVVCMDMNILISIEDLRTKAGWNDLYSRVKSSSDACETKWNGFSTQRKRDAIEGIREHNIVNGAATCGYDYENLTVCPEVETETDTGDFPVGWLVFGIMVLLLCVYYFLGEELKANLRYLKAYFPRFQDLKIYIYDSYSAEEAPPASAPPARRLNHPNKVEAAPRAELEAGRETDGVAMPDKYVQATAIEPVTAYLYRPASPQLDEDDVYRKHEKHGKHKKHGKH